MPDSSMAAKRSLKILIYGINYSPEPTGIAIYSTEMAEYFAREGNDVRVVTGRPYYPGWKIMSGHRAWTYGSARENSVTVLRCPHYIPANPSGLKRILHHVSFALSSLLPMLWNGLILRPDIVLVVAPSLIAAPVGRIAAFFGRAKSWLHIQDFEVEAAFATGLLAPDGRAARLARWFERTVLSQFDVISTISPQMRKKLSEKGIAAHKIAEYRNWSDISAIFPSNDPSPYRAQWGITSPHVALYSGSVGNKQGIELLVDAARKLHHRSDLTFVICGQGPHRERLEQLASGLSNIQFHDLQPKESLNALLNMATIHLLPQLEDAADLVLPSKLTNMLASGRPVIATTLKGTGLAEELIDCGLITPPGDLERFSAAIETLMDNADMATQLGKAARQAAIDRIARDSVLGRVQSQMQQVVSTGQFLQEDQRR
jgi:colanic acid biosynthesis glycosyl transferase WcaI